MSATQHATADLTVDKEVFAVPGGSGPVGTSDVATERMAGWTVGTTCWSCKYTCSGCDNSECFC